MNLDWQNTIALAAVALAALYVGYRLWQLAAGSGRCGCGTSCPAKSDSDKELVQIDPLAKTGR